MAASVVLTGTVLDGLEETNYVAGGKTLILTVTDDTWVTAGATFNAQRAAILAGIDSAQAEAHGWDAEIKVKEVVTAVVRTSATVVTITLSAAAAYNITLVEAITATVPAAALTGAGAVVATPTFSINPCVTSVLGFGNRSF
jgi:hypothetical protein